ncbi:argC [Symbiodinium sp. CCMP2456]|nr:argC [Symbiodinium sp. CCMP2456]
MALDDIGVFEAAGFQRDQVGMLATYGFVDFPGVRTLLRGIAERLRPGCVDLRQALAGMRFLDLGSGDGRAVIGAAVLAPTLVESSGVELSLSRHELAVRNRCRLPQGIQDIVQFQQIDILQVEPTRLGATEIVWLANLRFPDETVEAINNYLEEHCAKEVDAVVATLRKCSFRREHESWTMEVSMSWNPEGWPVYCYYLPCATGKVHLCCVSRSD